MPVPTLITDLSQTAASNSPAGSEGAFPNLDDYLRAGYAFTAQLNALKAPLTGAGATGTWPIAITGLAGSVAWTTVTGRPTNVSAFVNDAGYVTSTGAAAAGSLTGTTLAANVTASSLLSVGQTLRTANATGSLSNVRMNAGDLTHGGLLELFGPSDGLRQGYLGYATASGAIQMVCENAGGWAFSGGNVSATTFVGALIGNATTASTAASASSVPWTGVSGRPTSLSAFTNEAGYITGAGNAASATAVSGTTSNGYGTRTVSTAAPSGTPVTGDIWLQYAP